MNFTQKQIDAINHFKGPALVLAVPGSGKTTVLLNRILFLIENGIDPKNILSITFSKAQGLDMENRFNNSKEEYKGKVHFKTIHAFCYEILRIYFKSKNIKKTLIEGSSEFNRNLVVKREFFSSYGEKLRDEIVNDFFTIYDYTQNKMLDFEDFIKSNKFISNRQTMCKLFKVYTDLKEKNNYIDFNDLLILSNEYISKDKELLKYIKQKYKYFQVDEGQDTSTLQFEIIRKIVYPENNLFVVADDDQSIYSFRGASPENLLNFEKFYPNSKIIFMDKNFRSNNNIIKISNNIIKLNKNRYDKEIQFESDKNQHCIYLINSKNSKIQYRELLKRILDIPSNESIGILYRNNISSIPLANLFLENNIDFFIKDSKLEFFNNAILKDIKDILTFAEDTSNTDVFYRIYFKLNAYLKKEFLNILQYKNYYDDVFDSMLGIENLNGFYFSKISKLRNDFIKIKKLKLVEKIKYIYEELGYGEYLENLHDDSILNYNLAFDIILNICEKLEHTEDFFEKLNSIKEKLDNSKNSKSNISISTIHSSKGLEYDNVFVVDLVANEFPLKSSFEMSKFHIEEERRLFYVAITRAKNKLYLFTMKNRNGKEVKHSKFYEEIKKFKVN